MEHPLGLDNSGTQEISEQYSLLEFQVGRKYVLVRRFGINLPGKTCLRDQPQFFTEVMQKNIWIVRWDTEVTLDIVHCSFLIGDFIKLHHLI